MNRRLLILGAAFLLTAMSIAPSSAGDGSVSHTDPDDVPVGDADILATTKQEYSTERAGRMVSFRVQFQEATGDAYSLVRVRIDTRRGPGQDFQLQVDVLEKIQDEKCFLYELPAGDDPPKRCRLLVSTDRVPDAMSWRIPIRRGHLAPTKRIRWMIETDIDFGNYDRAPDEGWYA